MQCTCLHHLLLLTCFCIMQAGMYPEAAKAAVRVVDRGLVKHVNTLLAVTAFEQDNLPGEEAQQPVCSEKGPDSWQKCRMLQNDGHNGQ